MAVHKLLLRATTVLKLISRGAVVQALAASHRPNIAWAVQMAGQGSAGLAWGGFEVNALDIAPRYGGVVMGFQALIAATPGLVAPMVTSLLVHCVRCTDPSNGCSSIDAPFFEGGGSRSPVLMLTQSQQTDLVLLKADAAS